MTTAPEAISGAVAVSGRIPGVRGENARRPELAKPGAPEEGEGGEERDAS
jgi:hypothetical protein